jgi:hypothetical protein
MPIDFYPMLRNDLEKFLARYHLESICDISFPEIAEMDFPETDQKKEHLALSAFVARLLRLERVLAKIPIPLIA